VTLLTQAALVQVNRSTDELEPWLVEGWTSSADGLTYTMTLKSGILFSDGQPLTSADVLFSFRAAYDPGVGSPLGSALTIHEKPLEVTAPDARTVVVRFPAIRPRAATPRHPPDRSETQTRAGAQRKAIPECLASVRTVSDVVGLGPFQLVEHVSGQRLVFARNPHYSVVMAPASSCHTLDRLTLVITPDQNTEALGSKRRATSHGNGDIRSQDHATFRRLADQGRLHMIDVGVALDPDFLSFNLKPARRNSQSTQWIERRNSGGRSLRGRSPGDRQHRLSRCRRAALWTDHAGQPALVLGRRAGIARWIATVPGNSWPPRG
jgi:peptide/nickel transport system substrate-binding protein